MLPDDTPFDQFDRMYDESTKSHYWKSKTSSVFDVMPLEMVRPLDFGMMGTVCLMKTKPTDKLQGPPLLLAAKIFKFGGSEERMAWFLKEAGIMQSLQHSNIVTCFAPVFSLDYGILVMDFIPDGTLASNIDNLTEQAVHRFFIQIACALRYIHSQQIAHCDMKPHNVMIRGWSAIIIDFGLSTFLPPNGSRMIRGRGGTFMYKAPELRATDGETLHDPIKADSFSLGVILWCMMLEQLPDMDTKFSPFVFPKKMDSILTFCMRRLLRTDPEKRFDVTQLLAELAKRGYNTNLIESL